MANTKGLGHGQKLLLLHCWSQEAWEQRALDVRGNSYPYPVAERLVERGLAQWADRACRCLLLTQAGREWVRQERRADVY